MQGSIETRIRAKGRDAHGRMRTNLIVYDVRYRYIDPVTGKSKQRQKRGFKKRADAEAFLVRVNSEQMNGVYIEPKAISFKDYINDWLLSYAKLHVRESTYEGYQRIVDKHLIPALGRYEIKSITPMQIDAMYADLMRKGRADGKGGLSAKTVLYTHRVLNEALEHAVRRNMIARNPVKSVMNTPRPKKFHSAVYSVDELLELLRIVKDTVYELPIALAGICGLRRGECLALRPEDIDFEHHVIYVRRQLIEVRNKIVYTEPKSDESMRTVGVPEEIVEIVSRRIAAIQRNKDMLSTEYNDHGLLICKNDGAPFRPRNFTNSFKGILARNHLKRIRFHDLRHTCATLMLRSGIPMKTASEILGHSSISITADLYTHVQESAKLAAAEQVGELVFRNRSSRKGDKIGK